MTRADGILIAVAAVLVAVSFLFGWPRGPADRLRITAGDRVFAELPLSMERKIAVPGPLGDSVIEIHDHRARFRSSPCQHKICLRAGWLEQAGESAACIPNRVSIRLLGEDPAYDAVNY